MRRYEYRCRCIPIYILVLAPARRYSLKPWLCRPGPVNLSPYLTSRLLTGAPPAIDLPPLVSPPRAPGDLRSDCWREGRRHLAVLCAYIWVGPFPARRWDGPYPLTSCDVSYEPVHVSYAPPLLVKQKKEHMYTCIWWPIVPGRTLDFINGLGVEQQKRTPEEPRRDT